MVNHGAVLVVKTKTKTRIAMRDVHSYWTVTEGARSGRGRTRLLYNTSDTMDEEAALDALIHGKP